jgi:hypothetical protein
MSIILQPSSSFPLVRQISNHLDSTAYYVRAVVRNADGNIIDTVNLASQGAQRYQSRYRVPVDSSGQGAYISIITSVYTDAGYTTKSSNYGDEENTYLVFDRVLSTLKGGGGGNLDIGTIRRVVAEELAKVQPEPEEDMPEAPEVEEVDTITPQLERMSSDIAALQTAIARIPTDTLDLTDIKQAMETIYSSIENKEVTPETDLTPVMTAIDQLATDVIQELEYTRTFVQETEQKVVDSVTKTVESGMKSAKYVNEFRIEPATATKPVPQPEQPAYDINKLAS